MPDTITQTAHTLWHELWEKELGILADDTLFREIVDHYSEPHRAYHNLEHVVECLTFLREAPVPEADKPIGQLALWYHDIVYDPTRKDNEEQSAQLAAARLTECGLQQPIIDHITAAIRATQNHTCTGDTTIDLVLDADLSIFTQSRERLERYEAGIRQEYSHVDDETYRTHRHAFLQKLAKTTPLFCVDAVKTAHEKTARQGIRHLCSLFN